jgi:hypothetical protein
LNVFGWETLIHYYMKLRHELTLKCNLNSIYIKFNSIQQLDQNWIENKWDANWWKIYWKIFS